jgi:hypothetical protein
MKMEAEVGSKITDFTGHPGLADTNSNDQYEIALAVLTAD